MSTFLERYEIAKSILPKIAEEKRNKYSVTEVFIVCLWFAGIFVASDLSGSNEIFHSNLLTTLFFFNLFFPSILFFIYILFYILEKARQYSGLSAISETNNSKNYIVEEKYIIYSTVGLGFIYLIYVFIKTPIFQISINNLYSVGGALTIGMLVAIGFFLFRSFRLNRNLPVAVFTIPYLIRNLPIFQLFTKVSYVTIFYALIIVLAVVIAH